jgi:2-methylisocitrate lyase-like PEP mutase family enzyme
MSTPNERARHFHALHHGGEVLVLPNAWDAASARMIELAGARAIATTSAGVAAALGYSDGERVPPDLMLEAAARIVRVVDVPVSVDVEMGYGATVEAVCETVRGVLDAGGVGINIEDGMGEPALLVERIRAIRELAAARDIPLFVNARTDVYLRGPGDLDEAVRRLHAYEAAGADGLFVPGVADRETIAALVRAVHRPVNVLTMAGLPPVPELRALGIARVSAGSGPMRATLGLLRRIADELLHEGTYEGFVTGVPTHAEVNRMFARPSE